MDSTSIHPNTPSDDGVKKGKPYNKFLKLKYEVGDVVLQVPETLYSAAALIPTLGCNMEDWSGTFLMILVFAPLYIAAVSCAVAQGGAIYYVFEINNERWTENNSQGVDQCNPPDTAFYLRLICLVVFVATVSGDLKESFNYFQYCRRVPNRTYSDEERDALSDSPVSVLAQEVDLINDDGNEYKLETIGVGGFTWLGRCWAYVWGLVKIAAEMLLLVGGTGYVLYADSNENLLLNSVALTFISQIDDVAYNFTLTTTLKGIVTALPNIGLCDSENPKYNLGTVNIGAQFFGAWVQLLFLYGASAILWSVHCG